MLSKALITIIIMKHVDRQETEEMSNLNRANIPKVKT